MVKALLEIEFDLHCPESINDLVGGVIQGIATAHAHDFNRNIRNPHIAGRAQQAA